MEIFRALGSLIEPPSESLQQQAELLELGGLPDPSEHAEIFLFQLYPFDSVYLGNEGRMGGQARDRIAGFWRALSLESPTEPDHLTVLLSFYTELTTLSSDSGPGASRTGASDELQRVQWAFLWEHLLSWLPLYLDKLEALGSSFYQAWAVLLRRALEEQAATAPHPAYKQCMHLA